MLLERLAGVEARYDELTRLLAEGSQDGSYSKIAEYAKERASLEEIVTRYHEYKEVLKQLADARALLDDEAMRELAEAEIPDLERRKEELENRLKELLLPKDPRDEKSVIVEIRAGAGGDEAGIFAADLFRMYTRYAEARSWKTEILSADRKSVVQGKSVDLGGR